MQPILHNKSVRIALAIFAIVLLSLIYVFQRLSYTGFFVELIGIDKPGPNLVFAIDKTIRLILNDAGSLILILALFNTRDHLRIAFYIFLMEVLILLPAYLFLKLHFEGNSEISSPFFSQVHRIIVNPLMMFLLITGFYIQRVTKSMTPQ